MSSRFVPLTPRIGAKALVPHDDVLDPAFAGECRDALERYGVLLFPGIGLSDEEQVAFSRNLGEVVPQGPMRPDGTQEVIFKITLDPRENPSAEYLKATIGWHIDGLFDDAPPPKATMLSARRLAKSGGQTEFCNTYAAYEDLPADEREYYESLRIVHSLEASNRTTNPNPSPDDEARWRQAEAHRKKSGRIGVKEHPLVWRHATGRKSLVLGMTVDHVVGLGERESRALAGPMSRFLADDFADFQRHMEVNLLGVMLGSQRAARHMAASGGGSIVNMSSIAALRAGAGVMTYRAAKAAVVQLSRSLAIDLAEYGIRVNCIAPGHIRTAMTAYDMDLVARATQPLQRQGTPRDVAEAALYLAGERSAQVTGLVLPVDGGTTVGPPADHLKQILAGPAPGSRSDRAR
ncbi:MAG: SDR family oxidoreductase [Thermodesulfobacteriota bacterium]